MVTHPFDAEYGTDTGGVLSRESLSSGRRSDLWNTAYYGVSPSLFNQVLDALNLAWPGFTFVDLGSGKGRALLLASRLPFRAILGVELADELNEVARANVHGFSAPWQLCRNIEARNGDAALFEYPPGPLVVFLYHPFLAPVMKRCLRNLTHSLDAQPREAYLVYVNPILEALVERTPKLVMLWERTFRYSEEDVSADRLGGSADRVAVWRFQP